MDRELRKRIASLEQERNALRKRVRHLEASKEVASNAFSTLDEELAQARAELERERGWRKALASTAMCEAYCATSAGPGRECDCGMEHVFEEIQAAESGPGTINELSTREELIDE